MNAITTNFYDAANGVITDPIAFMALDADIKAQVIRMWARDHARLAKTFEDRIEAFLQDSQVGYAFLTPQLYRIETEVYMTRRPSFDISRFVNVDASGDMWDLGTVFYSMEDVGQAKFLAAEAFDMPLASNKMSQFSHAFHMAGIGYEWNTRELQHAARLGRALQSDKARAAVNASDRLIYNVCMTGKNAANVNEKGWTGLINDANAPSAQVANDGTGPSRLWSAKTADLILRDINEAIGAVETGTGETHVANKIILPTTRYNYIATARVGDTNQTVLNFLQQNNAAGERLTILKSRALETAGTGGSTRMIVMDDSPEVAKFHLPGPHQFLPPFQVKSMVYEVGGIMNIGGLEVRLPKAMVYRDSF